jgi:dienelactone hydrolase
MTDVIVFHHAQGLTGGVREFAGRLRASEFGCPWPQGVPLQIHAMDADELFVAEGDLDAARDLAATVEGAELYLYPGDQHLFADSSLPGYDESAATLLTQRVLSFLGNIG